MTEKQKRKVTSIASAWISLLGSISSIIAGVIANLAVFGIKEDKQAYLGVAVAFAAVLIAFTQTIKYFQRGPSKVVKLKTLLENAYCGALDISILNPDRPTGDKNV